MLLVLALVAGLWALGAVMGAPKGQRWTLIGLLFLAVLGIQLTFPEGHGLRVATGESLQNWSVVAILAVPFALYRLILPRLRRRHDTAQQGEGAPSTPGAFARGELDRYARHIVLREIGGPGQKALKTARVLVVGAGGLGAPALLYLAGAGVGRIGVIDPDEVDETNLQRQVIHADARTGMPKVFSAELAMKALNPFVEVRPYHRAFSEAIGADLVADYDLVLDGTDDVATRYAVNAACVAAGVPLISGALSQWEGQISVFDPARGAPCYRCLFPQPAAPGSAPSCAEAGVLGPLPGIVGSIMAAEAIKVLTGAGQDLRGSLLIYDALYADHRRVALTPRDGCDTCGAVQKDFNAPA